MHCFLIISHVSGLGNHWTKSRTHDLFDRKSNFLTVATQKNGWQYRPVWLPDRESLSLLEMAVGLKKLTLWSAIARSVCSKGALNLQDLKMMDHEKTTARKCKTMKMTDLKGRKQRQVLTKVASIQWCRADVESSSVGHVNAGMRRLSKSCTWSSPVTNTAVHYDWLHSMD